MAYSLIYRTPDGFDDIVLTSDGEMLTGLQFVGASNLCKPAADDRGKTLPVFMDTCRWLDVFFSGRQPDFTPVYRLDNLTSFRKAVLKIVSEIPFAQTMTYGDIAKRLKTGAAQAVGGAVGWNPIALIVPCHRVIGANGGLVGYSGGIKNKLALLRLEGHELF